MPYEGIVDTISNDYENDDEFFDYIEKTPWMAVDKGDENFAFMIGTAKTDLCGFNLYGTTGKDEYLRKRLNKVKNELFYTKHGDESKCCIEGCTHISPKTGKPCVRTFALHLGIEDESRFYILAIGLVFIFIRASQG